MKLTDEQKFFVFLAFKFDNQDEYLFVFFLRMAGQTNFLREIGYGS